MDASVVIRLGMKRKRLLILYMKLKILIIGLHPSGKLVRHFGYGAFFLCMWH